jgi:hypothetical protein
MRLSRRLLAALALRLLRHAIAGFLEPEMCMPLGSCFEGTLRCNSISLVKQGMISRESTQGVHLVIPSSSSSKAHH